MLRRVFNVVFPADAPDELLPWLFYWVFRAWRGLPISIVRRLAAAAVVYVAPDFPTIEVGQSDSRALARTFGSGAGVALFFGLVVQAGLCFQAGTLYGDDEATYYFINDYPNIVNYTALVPLYVGLGCVLTHIILSCYQSLKQLSARAEKSTHLALLPSGPAWWLTALIFAIAAAFTITYMSDLLDPEIESRRFWFIERLSPSGDRILGAAGLYYVLLTFMLIGFGATVVSIFMTLFATVLRLGCRLKSLRVHAKLRLSGLCQELQSFTIATAVAKGLAAALMVNAFTWRWQGVSTDFNFKLLIFVLTVFGIFLLSLPRYYVEVEWYRLEKIDAGEEKVQYPELRGRAVKIVSEIIDVTIVSLFIKAFL